VALKVIQKWFGHHLANAIDFDESVYGFIRGRSAPQAAAIHCKTNWVYCFDIKDFFSSTPIAHVIKSLEQLGYPSMGAQIISRLCSYNGCLAQGSPASPVLSNLVFAETDGVIKRMATKYEINYTRYADDIVFSGKDKFPDSLTDEVAGIIRAAGWKLAEQKRIFAKRPNRLKVHGLLVDGDYPRLTKGYRNKVRAYKHDILGNKVREEDIDRLKGHIAYASSVEKLKC
jgi:retron-type reverse transcriptase